MTFEEIICWADMFAKKLKGIKCCAILCSSEMAQCMALLSCFKAEVTALPMSQRYGELHCNAILDAISPDAVITDIGGEFQLIKIKDSKYIQPEVHPALIMCTSGTTGKPKGAMLSESNILSNLTDITAYFDINKSDTILITRPLYHGAVLTGEFLTALVKGTRICFYSGKFNPSTTLNLLKKYNVTAFCGTPTLLNLIQRTKREQNYKNLKHICVSGECMSSQVATEIANAFPNAKVYHVYGLTEAGPRVSYLPPNLFSEYPDCVGVPLKSVEIKIITRSGQVADKNEIGTLWVKGANVMIGYYNNPQGTNKVLKNGWLCTGDMALINDAGLLKIKGRCDDLIIKAGMNIYPQEIEAALKIDSRVVDVCAYGRPHELLGTQIILDIVGDFANSDEVIKLCQECLPSYQVPSRINLVKNLKKNASGKIIRR